MTSSPLRRTVFVAAVTSLHAALAHAQRPVELAPNAPADRPLAIALRCQLVALVDWTIARPDGSEEGNAVGNFMDRYRPPAVCTDSGTTDTTVTRRH